jgi:hypothetical protein
MIGAIILPAANPIQPKVEAWSEIALKVSEF